MEIHVECNCNYSPGDGTFVKVLGIHVLCACDVCQALDSLLCLMTEDKIKA